MEKLIYLLWAEGTEPDQTRKVLLEQCAPELIRRGALKLSMNIDDSDSEVPPPLPPPAGETTLSAEVSLWLECLDERGPFEQVLKAANARMAGYLVTESLYTDYGGNRHSGPRTWPDGERSPGLLTVTLIEQPERLTYEEWIERWHGTQSPVSERIQPRTRYVRNAVVRPLTEGAPPYKGIVDEAWPSAEHVTDPMLFYLAEGSEERMQANLKTMLESVNAFLDMDRIRTATMSEYFLKS